MLSFIKWSGSKRYQAEWIVNKFPSEINTYYEPFIGSGAVLLELLQHIDINVNRYEASDICLPLITLWKMVQSNPDRIIDDYTKFHNELCALDTDQKKKDYFLEKRKEFNNDKSLVTHFFFLTRTSINGLVRFNSSGNYNSTFHFHRDGIKPYTLAQIILENNRIIKNVNFTLRSYNTIEPKENDLIYMDPPYAFTKGMYTGGLNLDEYFQYVSKLKCNWLISFDGKKNGNEQFIIPVQYKNVYYAPLTHSAFRTQQQINVSDKIEDALYTNF